MPQVQELIDVVKANNEEMKKVMSEYASMATKSEAETKSLKAELEGLKQTNAEAIAKSREELETEVKNRQKLEAKLQRLPNMGAEGEVIESLGNQFIKSDALNHFKKNMASMKTSAAFETKYLAISNPTPAARIALQQTTNLGLIAPNYQTYHMRDLLSVISTSTPNIEWIRETIPGGFTDNSAIVPESGLKPESTFSFEEKIASVKTIAHYAQITNQMMEDNPQLAQYIDTRLRYGLALKEDWEILYGTGGADSLDGLKNAGVQTIKWSDGDAEDTMMDAILNAMVKSMISFYTPTGIVMNIKDMAKIRKSKSTTGEYLYQTTSGQPTSLWNLPVVESTLLSEGEFVVGNFDMACNLYDRDSVTMRIGEPGDSFLRNKKSILVEERLALVTTRPSAIVWGEFDSAPAS
jgi:HK97 family phage major capsid protein